MENQEVVSDASAAIESVGVSCQAIEVVALAPWGFGDYFVLGAGIALGVAVVAVTAMVSMAFLGLTALR